MFFLRRPKADYFELQPELAATKLLETCSHSSSVKYKVFVHHATRLIVGMLVFATSPIITQPKAQ